MNKLKNVVFDLGGVLTDWNPDYLYKDEFKTEEELNQFYSEVCTVDWNENQDAGYPLQLATEELVERFPQYEDKIRMFYGRWEEMLGNPIPGVVDILHQCISNPHLSVFALTNWSAETFPIAQQKFNFLQSFDGIVVSGEEKTIKPFNDIYLTLLRRYHILAEETVFIDDNQRNIKAAENLGFNIILFKSAKQLNEELKKIAIV